MFARLLVPVDFSVPSDAALEYARMLARSFDGALHLLHVTGDQLPPPHAAGDAPAPPALARMRQRLAAGDRPRQATLRLVEGADTAGEIIRYAATMPADLIVMGTHGRSGVAHLLMGSVAEAVVRTSQVPVLTVGHAPRASAAGFAHILVPTDFSGPSDDALDCARGLARRFDASVHLLHILEDPIVDGPFGSEVFVSESPGTRTARLRDARDRLSHRVPAHDSERGRLTTEVIVGPTSRTIVDYAADNGFDLIVMGTHGRTGLAHLLMGSVAERVVRSATCPVLTTHGVRPCAPVEAPAGRLQLAM